MILGGPSRATGHSLLIVSHDAFLPLPRLSDQAFGKSGTRWPPIPLPAVPDRAHRAGCRQFPDWSQRRAGLEREAGLRLKALFALFSKHEGWPGRAAVREFLESQTALASGGALNRTHKQTLDLL